MTSLTELSPLTANTRPPESSGFSMSPQQPLQYLGKPGISFMAAYLNKEYPGAADTRPLRQRLTQIDQSNSCSLTKLILKIVAFIWYGPKALRGTWKNQRIIYRTEALCTIVDSLIQNKERSTEELRLHLNNNSIVKIDISGPVTAAYRTKIVEFVRMLAKKDIDISRFEIIRQGEYNPPKLKQQYFIPLPNNDNPQALEQLQIILEVITSLCAERQLK